jgi:hypothetical protein
MAGSTHVAEFIVFRFFSGAGSYMFVAAPPVRTPFIDPSWGAWPLAKDD